MPVVRLRGGAPARSIRTLAEEGPIASWSMNTLTNSVRRVERLCACRSLSWRSLRGVIGSAQVPVELLTGSPSTARCDVCADRGDVVLSACRSAPASDADLPTEKARRWAGPHRFSLDARQG